MRLRIKTALAAFASLAVILLLLRAIAQWAIIEPFEVLEADALASGVRESMIDIDREGLHLRAVAKDYGQWNDAFEFATTRRQEFLSSNFTIDSIQNLSCDFMVILNNEHKVLAAYSFVSGSPALQPVRDNLIKAIRQELSQTSSFTSTAGGHGIIMEGSSWAIVGVSPILDSQKKGPARGSMIFGRFIDAPLLQEIASHSTLNLVIRAWDPSLVLPEGMEQWSTSNGSPVEVVALDAKTAFARIAVPDIHGHPTLWLEATKKLESYPRAVRSIRTFTLLLILCGIAICGIILSGLQRIIVSRIEKLHTGARRIGANPDSQVRFSDTQADEIGALAGSIDNMVVNLRRAAGDLRESEERLRHVLDATNEGIWDWDLLTGRIHYSVRWANMLGLEHSRLEPSPHEWLDRVHPEDRESLESQIRLHLEGGSDALRAEYRIRESHGTYRWVFCRGLATRDAAGKAIRFAGSQTDITDRHVAEEQLLHDAFNDKLTGLPNRALFLNWLSRCLHRMGRHPGYHFAVFYLDLDLFKKINDSLGHLAGDELLLQFGQRLMTCIRDGDAVGRLGGDEFVVLADDLGEFANVHRIAQRILDAMTKPFTVAGAEFFIGTSIGIALSNPRYEKPEEILRDADTALYRSKAQGRGQYSLFDTAMHESAIARLGLETDLRRALERDELYLLYQPIVSLTDGYPVGVEALVRWRHPARGIVSPGEFIALAEETGLIVEIGKWVMTRACSDLARWAEQSPLTSELTLAVNVSPRQFRRGDLASLVESVIKEVGISATRLKLEITESVFMENPEQAAATIDKIRDTGAGISLDDFGTGYSSLSYLQRFDIDVLKIDGTFVKGLGSSAKNEGIIHALVLLAKSLQVPIVAEGVETLEQRNLLQELGCQFAQGYYFARPLDEIALLKYLESFFQRKVAEASAS